MSGSIRIEDLPDLGAVTDASSVVADKAGSGLLSATALRTYCTVGMLSDAPLDGTVYGRLNASWYRVLPTTGGEISGNLGVIGATTLAGTATVGGNLSALGSLSVVGPVSVGDTLSVSDSVSALGSLSVGDTLSVVGPVSVGDTLSVSDSVTANQYWVAGTGGAFGLSVGGSGRVVSFMPSFYLDFAVTGPTAGTLQYVDTGGPLWVMRAADQFCFNPQSSVGGNGAYINTSDKRVKANVTPSDKGLAEVLQLQPVTFTRTNPAAAGNEIGFVAQDVQPIVPEAVWGNAGLPREDGEPLLGLSSETITALNVNAIKELHSMITALQTRIATLEAAAG